MIRPLSNLTAWGYRTLVKPLLFLIPPDHIHDRSLYTGDFLSRIPFIKTLFRTIYAYQDPLLSQTIAGVQFSNPVGLAAGYDYDGYLTQILADLGFGFQTVGTVTYGTYPGNTPPMYGRLKESRSLWVNKGFKSMGVKKIVEKLTPLTFAVPVGVSIGATNRPYENLETVLIEYQRALLAAKKLKNISYLEINISCPNLVSHYSLYEPKSLNKLLNVVDSLQLKKPLFIKMPIDISVEQLHNLLDIIRRHQITGIIIGNLTKKRDNPRVFQVEAQQLPEFGGLSGKPTQHLSDQLIKAAYRYAGKDLIIIGCGGIFSAADAYQKIKYGASLVQFITGMIYVGPQLPGQLNQDLAEMVARDGFSHLSEAIGLEA